MEQSRLLSLDNNQSLGGMRALGSLAFPMMSIPLFTNLMIFLDRVILGHYSVEAMNAVAAAASAISPLVFGAWSIATIAEVFVGQLHGGQRYGKMAQPVWQMVWFSLFLGVLFIPLALWAGPYLLPKSFLKEGLPYYKCMMASGFLIPLNTALASFFVGSGNVKIIGLSVMVGALVNIGLDLLLIFGIPGIIPSLGTLGAAIATTVGAVTQTVILGILFSKHSLRMGYPPAWRICWKTMKDCIIVGGPNALSYLMEMSGWYAMFVIADRMSTNHVTILQIGYSLYTLFSFLPEGLQKGVIILSSNSVGRQNFSEIPMILRSSCKFHLLLMGVLAIPLLLFPEQCIKVFLGSELEPENMALILSHGRLTLFWVWCALFCDELGWIISGILTSAGDTKFVMKLSFISVSCFWLLPVHTLSFSLKNNPGGLWGMMVCYGVMNFFLFFRRYKMGEWRNIRISSLSLGQVQSPA